MKLSYSNAIILGLKKIGFDSKRLHEVARIPTGRIKSVITNQLEFTDKELGLIEQSTGRTAGQLAALAVEPKGGPLTKILNQWASLAKRGSGAKSRKTAVS